MKYIITESQEEKIRKSFETVLNSQFSKLPHVCEIKVYINDPNEYEYRFDVYVFLKESYYKTYNKFGQDRFSEIFRKKIEDFIENNFPFKCYVGSSAKEC